MKQVKLTTYTQTFLMSFLFGPIAGGLLSASDLKAMKKNWWLGALLVPNIIIFVGIFIYMYLVPDNVELPSTIIPVTYSVVYALTSQMLNNEANQNGVTIDARPWSEALGYGLVGLVGAIIMVIILLIPAFLMYA